MSDQPALLQVDDLHVAYGAIRAVRGVSLRVPAGQLVALIGANGAGKSTILRTLSGLIKAASGTITFDGQDITRSRADRITARGLIHVPEGRQIIAPLTVEENLLMGAYTRSDAPAIRADLDRIYARFPRLADRRTQRAGLLSGGEQQMLAIGRALMAKPRLLMLDEPSMGLAPLLVDEVFRVLQEIKAEGTTLLLVEQNARQALAIADYAYVLERGEVAYADHASALAQDQRVIAAYLG
jgi:branched-chain amino acid transport system ATP-binding protein